MILSWDTFFIVECKEMLIQFNQIIYNNQDAEGSAGMSDANPVIEVSSYSECLSKEKQKWACWQALKV